MYTPVCHGRVNGVGTLKVVMQQATSQDTQAPNSQSWDQVIPSWDQIILKITCACCVERGFSPTVTTRLKA